MPAYSFGFNISRGGTPTPVDFFKGEIEAFIRLNPTAKVTNCSMSTVAFSHNPSAVALADGIFFGVIFYEEQTGGE